MSPWDKKEEANQKKLEFAVANSDYLALLRAYKVHILISRYPNTYLGFTARVDTNTESIQSDFLQNLGVAAEYKRRHACELQLLQTKLLVGKSSAGELSPWQLVFIHFPL